MENLEGQVKYLQQYIQRQETLLLDNIRKCIDIEIKTLTLNNMLSEMTAKYEHSQDQVQSQNDLMQQAATSVERLTIENKTLTEENLELQKTLDIEKKQKYSILEKMKELEEEAFLVNKKNEELMKEYQRQNEEMTAIFQENQELKRPSPQKKVTKKQNNNNVF